MFSIHLALRSSQEPLVGDPWSRTRAQWSEIFGNRMAGLVLRTKSRVGNFPSSSPTHVPSPLSPCAHISGSLTMHLLYPTSVAIPSRQRKPLTTVHGCVPPLSAYLIVGLQWNLHLFSRARDLRLGEGDGDGERGARKGKECVDGSCTAACGHDSPVAQSPLGHCPWIFSLVKSPCRPAHPISRVQSNLKR
ncbi:hypothetical protein BP00DRAFT_76085 [Aspergillus indologenus CBS 114.80]|uniref:Uncharacterized protein n=1 Tax=Aspergillus indologenus CBS 114.80 TaxID=1450541 RepID=A0A2V5IGE4_9EURO|nr:hypothetical protein BP00DRAFT_76085 [Aspergillus indologenus CBS 114.80]